MQVLTNRCTHYGPTQRERDKAKCSPLLYGSVSAGPTGGDPGTLDTAEGQRAREGGTESEREGGRERETDNPYLRQAPHTAIRV